MRNLRLPTCFLICLLIATPVSLGVVSSLNAGRSTSESNHTPLTYVEPESECSSVIVTGNATKDGRAILTKNRDWPYDRAHRPIYYPATTGCFAIVAINQFTMGINEVGLAVMNTAMPSLEPDPGYGNLLLNQKILETCESVDEVARRLADSQDPIGPNHRSELGTVATCVGVVDRFGEGAFFEVSNSRAYVEYVVDGFSTRANTPLVYGGGQRDPSGRALYLRDALDDIYAEHGMIDWQDVMHSVSRCIRDKEQRSAPFSIDGEACNTNTVGAMVAVSGDSRYGGKLNCMWGACGPNPLVGVFLPAMVHIGEQPSVQATLWSETCEKWSSAQTNEPGETVLLDPYRVREIQSVAFYAENYTCFEYDHLMSTIQDGLTNEQLELMLGEFINRTVNYAAAVYVSENTTLSIPERTEYEFPEPTPTGSTSSTHPSSATTPVSTSESLTTYDAGNNTGLGLSIQLGIGFAVGLAVVVLAGKRILS